MAIAERRVGSVAICALAALLCVTPAPSASAQQTTITGLSAGQLLELAGSLERDNQPAAAERIYESLAHDPNLAIRNEARCRPGRILAGRGELAQAAALYRAILDEEPNAQRVRIELSELLARMGDSSGARRELRLAQAGGLPAEVARAVDQFDAALRSTSPFGASFELALAPSNNINRATRATTLDTVIAPFELSEDARAQSGTGVRLGGQGFARKRLSDRTRLIFRLAGLGNFYDDSSFDDVVGSIQGGVERLGPWRLSAFAGRSYRWYGEKPYATTDTATFEAVHALGADARLSLDLGLGQADYRLNDLQDGAIYTGEVFYERAFSEKFGAGLGASFERQEARDPGYATTAGEAKFLAWRELSDTALFGEIGVSRLVADARLTLFPERREDWRSSVTLGATLRQFRFHGFAPVVRASYERNQSTVGLYDYSRFSGDLGLSRSF